jgi:hypothetical protein
MNMMMMMMMMMCGEHSNCITGERIVEELSKFWLLDDCAPWGCLL